MDELGITQSKVAFVNTISEVIANNLLIKTTIVCAFSSLSTAAILKGIYFSCLFSEKFTLLQVKFAKDIN